MLSLLPNSKCQAAERLCGYRLLSATLVLAAPVNTESKNTVEREPTRAEYKIRDLDRLHKGRTGVNLSFIQLCLI